MIWKTTISLEGLNAMSPGTLVENLGIEFIDFDEESLTARMPVDKRTFQPLGLLHGGASVSLAETIGSVASTMCIDVSKFNAVGLEINANHLRGIRGGFVYGTCRPVKLGRTIHVWNIEIKDEEKQLICASRLTMAIIPRR